MIEDLKQRLNNELWPPTQPLMRSNDLRQKIYEDFKIYFENEEMLRIAADTGFLIYDYNFFCKNFKGSIFEFFLLEIIEIYRSAKHISQDECFSFLLAHEPDVSRGFSNTTDIVHTQQNKNIPRLNFYAKVCFRELGDFIEGSFQPFIKELLGLHLLKKMSSAEAIKSVAKTKLGDAVAILINDYEDLSILYKHVLNGVSLNQWRNIAHHNSYSTNEKTNQIECTYGPNGNQKKILISRADLLRISLGIANIQYLHKIAHAIFMADNFIPLSEKRPEVQITKDTAIMQCFETLASRGFKVLDLKTDDNETILDVSDTEARDIEGIENSIKEVVPALFSLLNKLSLNVHNNEGDLLFEIMASTTKYP